MAPSVSPKSRQFFKIILNPQAHKLRIPKGFERITGVHLPNRVFLKTPTGPVFEVEVIHSNGKIWLHKGWEEFKEYYSLDEGHLLLFKYDHANSHFRVIIFDKTASEIEYPSDEETNVEETEENDDDENDDEDDDEDEDDDDEDDDDETNDSGSEWEDSDVFLKEIEKNKKGKEKILDDEADNVSAEISDNRKKKKKQRKSKINEEISIAYQRAKAFESDNASQNTSFTSLMRPRNISNWNCLNIPLWIVRENCNKRKVIKLRVSGGKLWPVKCSIQGKSAGRITCGWKDFVKGNALKVGDACVFEVNKTKEFVWDVTIFRG